MNTRTLKQATRSLKATNTREPIHHAIEVFGVICALRVPITALQLILMQRVPTI